MNRLVMAGVAVAVVAVGIWSGDAARALTVGWVQFLWRVVPRITWNGNAIALSVATFVLFTLGVHWLGRAWLRGRRSERRWRLGWSLGVGASVIVVFAAGICMIGVTHQTAWLLSSEAPAIVAVERPQWGAANRSSTNLATQLLGLHNYHALNGKFASPESEARRSWATCALVAWYSYGNDSGRIDFKYSWNDPVNQRFFRGVIPDLINPELRTAPVRDAEGYGLAHYAANCRAMTDGAFRPFKEFADGTANTLLIGEVNANFRPWGDPANVRDPARGVNRSAYGFGGPLGSGGALFGMADGSVRFVSERVSPAVLKALATPDGGESVDPSVLQNP